MGNHWPGTIYRCIHCGGETGETPEDADRNARLYHGRGVCVDIPEPSPDMSTSEMLDYARERMDPATGEVRADCGCRQCDNGRQMGHFACDQSDPILLQLERDGYVDRRLISELGASEWAWFARGERQHGERRVVRFLGGGSQVLES